MGSIVEVSNLSRTFKDVTALKDVSFSVNEGEIFALLGPNGAGKTTTINIICTLEVPSSGSVRVDGLDVTRDTLSVRKKLGIIFQDPSLDDRLTAYENMMFQARLYGVPGSVAKQRALSLLEKVGLLDRRDSIVKTFSGGMKRRLEAARGLLHEPKILFLDEPTLGLDLQTRKLLWDYVLELRERTGVTVFLTTHYIEEAHICNNIAILDHGALVAQGSPEELRSQVSEDVIQVECENPEALVQEAQAKFQITGAIGNGCVNFHVPHGESFLPRLLRETQQPVSQIMLHKPTLNDVFMKLTGRSIREEEGEAVDRMRLSLRLRGKRS